MWLVVLTQEMAALIHYQSLNYTFDYRCMFSAERFRGAGGQLILFLSRDNKTKQITQGCTTVEMRELISATVSMIFCLSAALDDVERSNAVGAYSSHNLEKQINVCV